MDNQSAFYHLPPQVMSILAPLNVGAGLLNPEIVKQVRGQLRGRRVAGGQFLKAQVLYMPVSLIMPAAYVYDCAGCTFYRQSSKTCELVAGNIEPYAWCGLWLTQEGDQPFSWLARMWK
ncbi:MAG: hypothetical protein MUO24_03540 [Desulfobacterales bacterium]|nr:hypothetical protein [Desulfobacterales bacterium]